jgi:hypothetical protein
MIPKTANFTTELARFSTKVVFLTVRNTVLVKNTPEMGLWYMKARLRMGKEPVALLKLTGQMGILGLKGVC